MLGLKLACVLVTTGATTASFAQTDDRLADTFVVGAIGDSITAGFDARYIGDNRELSWSTGSDSSVKSHAQRLSAQLGQQVTTYNVSVAGSVVADLDSQVTSLLDHKPDYVTITIGANDICSWSADFKSALAAYKSGLRAQIDRMITARPHVRVLISPIPDMYNLWKVAHNQTGCQARWDFVNLCRPLLAAGLSDQDRLAFKDRLAAANDALASLADEDPAHVFFDPALAHTEFDWNEVSTLDCFHPSIAGQNLLADKTWQAAVQWLNVGGSSD